jgi:hypothetical protein
MPMPWVHSHKHLAGGVPPHLTHQWTDPTSSPVASWSHRRTNSGKFAFYYIVARKQKFRFDQCRSDKKSARDLCITHDKLCIQLNMYWEILYILIMYGVLSLSHANTILAGNIHLIKEMWFLICMASISYYFPAKKVYQPNLLLPNQKILCDNHLYENVA